MIRGVPGGESESIWSEYAWNLSSRTEKGSMGEATERVEKGQI